MRGILIIFLIALIGLNSGCHTLRKKFIRKKKYKEEPAYVRFKEYPKRPTRDAYLDYYLFVRGWLEELVESLETGSGYKRQRRAINEAIMNVEQIMSFFNTEGKDEFYPSYEELLEIRKQVERGVSLSSSKRYSLIRDIENWKRRFEKDFNYTDAEKWMD